MRLSHLDTAQKDNKTGNLGLHGMENGPEMQLTMVACTDQQLHVIVPAHTFTAQDTSCCKRM